MRKVFAVIGLFMLLTSCFKEDEPVPPYESPAGVSSAVAEMGPDYAVQIYYDLGTHTFVKTTHRESWDLALQCGAGKYHVYLNSSTLMSVANTGLTDFSAVNASTGGLEYKYDISGGYEDSTAIGEWGVLNGNDVVSHQYVYVLDRGVSTTGNSLGKKKIQFIELTNGMYRVRVANLDGSAETIIDAPQNDDYNFTHISFNGNGGVADVEPPKANWDLLFTQYTTLVAENGTGILYNYSVNGVLINPDKVRVAKDFVKPFEQIAYTDLDTYAWLTAWDAIGYEWKYYDFDASTYVVLPVHTYLIQSTEGDYYKLRFTAFVNNMGVKGYPAFEVSKF